MAKVRILEMLSGKWEDGTRPKDLYALHLSPDAAAYADDVVAGLRSENRRVQNGCAELASLLSAEHPELLYPHLALFAANLDAPEPILRWEAACTIGNLVAVDAGGKIRASIEKLTRFLDDESIVLQGHAVRALAQAARAFPDLAAGILARLIAARERFPGNRIGYVLEALEVFAPDPKLAAKARALAEDYAESEIKSVATKARKALKKLAAGA